MSQVSNAQNIAFSTAFATDKICGIYNGSFAGTAYDTVYAGYLYVKKIPHTFGRPVMCEGLFSYDNTNFFPSGTGYSIGTSFCMYSDNSFIYILYENTINTVYYKIVATWIDNYDLNNPLITPVLSSSSSYTKFFDSRYNYQKVLMSGVITLPNPGVGVDTPVSINHNLGYLPNYKLYFESLPNQVWEQIGGGSQDVFLYNSAQQFELYDECTTTTLNLHLLSGSSSAPTARCWYRIYYDV
jgi:hypothetical protein